MTNSDTCFPDQSAPQLKDYYCPFCNHKLFRGDVKEFKMVCQECNRLVDSNNLPSETEEQEKEA
ncbi:MAG: hypothetical protein MI863_15985 [Desulfobacterales bacterium]|nr:hypothetical protein [Desulfobacterales bacterium]